MTDQSLDSKFIKIVGPVIASAVGAAIGWLTGGTGYFAAVLTTLFAVLGGICALAFSVMYRRYLGVLASGGARKGSPARNAYDGLRESLSGGNIAARIYNERLRDFLEWIERFFGDVGMADRTLFPHAFGLKTPAPLWTAPAFDRCLLLALIYPIATIFLMWTVSGHVGRAESALYLRAGIPGWQRAAAAASVFFGSYSYWQFTRAQGWIKSVIWLALAVAFADAVVGVFAVPVVGVFAVAVAVAGAVAGPVALVGAVAAAGAVTFAAAGAVVDAFLEAGALAGAVAVAFAGAFAGAVAVAGAFAFAGDELTGRWQHGIFLAVFVVAMIALCLGAPAVLASGQGWGLAGPLLLFLGLLTFINAPFDWASIGLTRALLRRGLELGGWWPYAFALVDAALAAVIITVLTVTTVVVVQAFDTVAVHSGGPPVLPLRRLFDGIGSHPSEPEYWWVYAILISSMIPSFINLMIGGASFLRGIPGLPSVLLGFLPAGKAVPTFDRAWIALVLTVQTFFGAILGIAAQAVLAIGIIGYVLPWLGIEILDTACQVADFNLPERVWRIFSGA